MSVETVINAISIALEIYFLMKNISDGLNNTAKQYIVTIMHLIVFMFN